MPELPEVQTIVDDLTAHNLIGAKIIAFRVFWRRSLNNMTDDKIRQSFIGRTIKEIKRRGKYIVFVLDDKSLALLHLRMSGRIKIVPQNASCNKHEHFVLKFDNGLILRLHDTRKFARFYMGRDTLGRLEKLGPEPLDKCFKSKRLGKILTGRNRMLKPLLLDQTVIAGLGNIYVDESLWEAGLHPQKRGAALKNAEIGKLYKAIRLVLRRGIRNCGTSLGAGLNNFISVSRGRGGNHSYLRAYGRQGKACQRCKAPIRRIKVARRSTYICPFCQK